MRKHPQLAYDMLKSINFLKGALDIPYAHHEWWDGSGYPRGLQGEQIPLSARIFAFVDVWDAVTSNRLYRKAWSREKAIAYIQDCVGTHLDPNLGDIFLQVIAEEENDLCLRPI
jgi:HD-GYP domain-containing protein (c-di-GMP phosphodiesterase class II)